MMQSVDISIIMGSFNQADILKRVLMGFQDQSFSGTFEVIVVDSSSTDGTHDLFDSFNASFVFRPIIQENNGKAAARNRGVSEARSDYIIITDSDMIPDKHFVQTHYDAHQSSSTPSCFEGVTYNLKTLHWPPKKECIYAYISRDYKDGKSLGWYYFLTGNISFPKSIFDSEGGFSEDFLNYGWEDLELGYRLSKKKVPLYYLKSAINYHYHVITEDEEIQRNVAKGASAAILIRKHPALKTFCGLNPLSTFLHPRLKKNGRIYSWIEKKCYRSKGKRRHAFGFWFLKEYHYLEGLLGSLST
ncbi:hypothetical protein DID77_00945 [Candidatus Marinamargulisbacteria bacterium SCGC AG-439-L15]|nr:hypothetical protein DID77_00945 [Candidatus Marinamargulisbacteria bacterium SCGC AG-439-L15]